MDGVQGEGASAAGVTPRAGVLRINAYKGGEGGEQSTRAIKLSSNENPSGPSSRAIEAYRRVADRLGVYPDGAATILRDAIAGRYGVDPARVVCGSGSDELIGLLCQAFSGPGTEIIHTEFAFAMYRIYALSAGAEPIAAPERAMTADVDAILAAVTPRTRIVFIANPNNPTGSYLPHREIVRLADALPGSVLLVIDGAYAEYMRERDYDPGLKLVGERENVVVTRTFSKIHGLAGLRLGWMKASPMVVDAVHRIRSPFNVNAAALAAGAAAIEDLAFQEASALQNELWRDWLTKRLLELGVETPPTFANFVLPRFGVEGPRSAPAVDAFLRGRGIFVRRMESYGMPDRLRITVGAPSQNVELVDALTEFLEDGSDA